MKFRRATVFFLSAAALTPLPAVFAEDSGAGTSATEERWNLSGSDDLTIASDTTLSVVQQIDGDYAGTLSGSGVFVKKGDANLTLSGTVSLSGSEAMSVEEGALTLAGGIALPERQFAIKVSETGTLVLAPADADATAQLVVSGEGTVVSTGTAHAESLAGGTLSVNAGTLAVQNATAFDEIRVLAGATLQVGTGTAASQAQLSGNVSLEKDASLVFNRSDNSSIRYDGQISGQGDVAFSGSSAVFFAGGADQTYEGTTTVNAGGMIFERATQTGSDGNEYYDPEAKAATLSSAQISVNGGNGAVFGGHVTAKGDVSVNGTAFSSVSDWEGKIGENTFGAWHYGAGTLYAGSGQTLTIEGNLKIAETELEIWFPSETTYDYAGNSGGAMRVEFGALGAGKVVALGNVELGGTLILAGAEGLEPGQSAVIFESDPGKTSGAFSGVAYGSDNVVLLLPGVGGIREGQLGMATTENRNVRERASFNEHEGAGEFVDYLVSQADGMNKVAQAVALAGSDAVTDVVNNFSPLAYSAFAETAMHQSDAEWTMILHEISRAREHRPESEDGVRVPANFTFFSGLLTDFIDHEDGEKQPVYDFNSIGVYAGGHTWLDDERIAGFSVGVHRSSAQPHGDGGSLDDSALRAKIFAVFAPKFSEWFLTLGGTVGLHYYDAERNTLLGENSGTTDGVDAGLFLAFNYREKIADGLYFTPRLSLEYNFSYVGGFEEHGTASRLDLRRITTNTYRVRAGAGFEYRPTAEKLFGIDFGFVANFGERPRIVSEFVEYENSRTTVKGTLGESMLFEIAPRVGVDLGNGWSADAVYRAQCSFEGSFGQAFSIGFSKEF